MELGPAKSMMTTSPSSEICMTQAFSYLQSNGPDHAAAAALAQACGIGGEVPAFDPTALDHALQTGHRCIVVWSDPQATLAAALRSGVSPTDAAAAWTAFAHQLLQRVAGNLILVDANVLHASNAVALLQPLTLIHPLPPLSPAPPRDAAALLAALMLPHLPDLLAADHELRAASLSTGPSPLSPTDLNQLAGQSRGPDRIGQERDLLRAQLQSLSLAAHPLPDPALFQSPAQSPAQSTEIALLRDQLRTLSSLLESNTGSDFPVNPQLHQGSTATFAESQTVELGLLRDHLTYLQSDLDLGGAAQPSGLPTTSLANIEAAIARLLADLVVETDRRILAEHDAQAARASLRRHGVDGPAPPSRTPVSARPAG